MWPGPGGILLLTQHINHISSLWKLDVLTTALYAYAKTPSLRQFNYMFESFYLGLLPHLSPLPSLGGSPPLGVVESGCSDIIQPTQRPQLQPLLGSVIRLSHSRPLCCSYLLTKSCLILSKDVDYSPPGSCVHGISQARILEWVAISFSRGSS